MPIFFKITYEHDNCFSNVEKGGPEKGRWVEVIIETDGPEKGRLFLRNFK